jgi:hypothetical protein
METAISVSDEQDRVRFVLDGTRVADYIYRPDDPRDQSPRPYFDELRTRRGVLVSESHPDDHPWHRGLSLALPVINNENFWGGPSYLRGRGYVQLENNGEQRHIGFTVSAIDGGVHDGRAIEGDVVEGAAPASFAEALEWHTEAGDRILTESRTVSVSSGDANSWVLTFSSVLTNVASSALSFGSPTTRGRPNGGYGGLFWRGPRQLTDAWVISPLGTGGDDMRGRRSPWMGLTGYAGGTSDGITVVMVDGEDNLRTPPEWFVGTEDYPCLCPAPFFSTEFTLEAGSPLRLDYAVVIADGTSDLERGAALAELGRVALADGVRNSEHPEPPH